MRTLLFDMDGTMIDNMMVHHRAWQQKLAEHGLDLTLEMVQRKVHGVNVEILEQLFGDELTMEERIQISNEKEEAYRKIYEPELCLIDGLPEFLHELNRINFPMGVGSAAPPENVDFVLNKLDLWHYFDSVKHSGDVSNGKPHPEVYLKLLDEMGAVAQDCIVFEDTPIGAEAAKRAGCSVIVVTTSHQANEFEGNEKIIKFINDFTEISVADILTYLPSS